MRWHDRSSSRSGPKAPRLSRLLTLPLPVRRAFCWAWGHNLIGVRIPSGWSVQTCRSCGTDVEINR